MRNLDDRQLLTAAEVARRNELYDRAINTADKTESVHDFSLRYLAPYREVLKARASQMNLDEAWVYGLIRQESRFIVDARSSVGASGLMQLMPATAKWVAEKMGMRRHRRRDRSRHQRDPRHVLPEARARHARRPAGAGVRRLQRGSGPRARVAARRAPIEGAIYAETDPLQRDARLREESDVERELLRPRFSQQIQSLKQRLGTIGPRQRAREPALGDTP